MAVVVSGCDDNPSPEPPTPSGSAAVSPPPAPSGIPAKPGETKPAIGGIEVKIDVRAADQKCAKQKCWLPTQFQSRLVAGETVSTRDLWPLQGDTVLAYCRERGERNRDLNGNSSDLWYGIVVPKEWLDEEADGRARKITLRGKVGYRARVNGLWLTEKDLAVESCSKFK